ATEFFQRYDLRSGDLKQVVHTDHELLRVTIDSNVWPAGKVVPLRVRLTAVGGTFKPRYRVWARPFASLDYREFPLQGDKVQVPADGAGLYVIKVTPEILPAQHLVPSNTMVRTIVEIRQPGTKGSATVLTPANRMNFGRGEPIPFRVVVRGHTSDEPLPLVVKLTDGTRVLAQGQANWKPGSQPVAWTLPATLTAGLKPGRYALTVTARGLTCAG